MIEIERCTDQKAWDEYVLHHDGHPLQLWGWGELKAKHGWRVERLFVGRQGKTIAAAQVLTKHMPRPFRAFSYVPRGVVGEPSQETYDALAQYVKTKNGSFALSVEPHQEKMFEFRGWKKSKNTILVAETLILDLKKSDDELLSAMTKKTRQYIRKSEREGLSVKLATNPEQLAACLAIYKQTAERAGFALHNDDYYLDLKKLLRGHSPVYVAYENKEAVAFLWLATSRDIAFELYGGVTDRGQQLRANYMLKWHAIKEMKEQGITSYDMNGLLNDGISTFKMGFASHTNQLVGTYDKPLSPVYFLWSTMLPLAKYVLRGYKSLRR